jgi:hypothetical protein
MRFLLKILLFFVFIPIKIGKLVIGFMLLSMLRFFSFVLGAILTLFAIYYYNNRDNLFQSKAQQNDCRVPAFFNATQKYNRAFCLIKQGDKTVMIKQSFNFSNPTNYHEYALPGGKPLSQEKAPCTAIRQTFEQTGLFVEVSSIAYKNEDYIIFKCTPLRPISSIINYSKIFYSSGVEILSNSEIATKTLSNPDIVENAIHHI